MSKIKNGGLDQYDTEPFEQQQFGTVDVEGVNYGTEWWANDQWLGEPGISFTVMRSMHDVFKQLTTNDTVPGRQTHTHTHTHRC